MKNKDFLKPGEVFDDLQLDGLQIIQSRSEYCFTSDSVLLANFAKVKKIDFVLEFCSGCGVISILVNKKCSPKEILGIEINPKLYDMSTRSLVANNINNITFVCDDIKNINKYVKSKKADAIICNPPYFVLNKNEIVNEKYINAKYETTIFLPDIFESAKKSLKYGGKMFLCFTPTRLQELLSEAQKRNFVCKKLQFVYPKNKQKLSTLVLVEFVKNGNKNLEVLEPKFV